MKLSGEGEEAPFFLAAVETAREVKVEVEAAFFVLRPAEAPACSLVSFLRCCCFSEEGTAVGFFFSLPLSLSFLYFDTGGEAWRCCLLEGVGDGLAAVLVRPPAVAARIDAMMPLLLASSSSFFFFFIAASALLLPPPAPPPPPAPRTAAAPDNLARLLEGDVIVAGDVVAAAAALLNNRLSVPLVLYMD